MHMFCEKKQKTWEDLTETEPEDENIQQTIPRNYIFKILLHHNQRPHPLHRSWLVIFMVHGYGNDISWTFQATPIFLAPKGFACFALDLQGHGHSGNLKAFVPDVDDCLSFFTYINRGIDHEREQTVGDEEEDEHECFHESHDLLISQSFKLSRVGREDDLGPWFLPVPGSNRQLLVGFLRSLLEWFELWVLGFRVLGLMGVYGLSSGLGGFSSVRCEVSRFTELDQVWLRRNQ